jgi:hypothetical protein
MLMTGPQTLPEYQVSGGAYDVKFWIKPITGEHVPHLDDGLTPI